MKNQVVNPDTSGNEKSLTYAWYVVFILMLANISSFIDRQILALLVAPIKRDMHLTDTQISLLMGLSFALFYTFFGLFIGRLADKYNRRNIIMVGITVWSLMTALCAGVRSYSQFFAARMGVGVGEATLGPSAYSIISDYFPRNKLATALSTYSMGIFLGSGLAILIGAGLVSTLPTTGTTHIPLLGDVFHWQKLFIYIGLPGILISLLLFTIKEPSRKDLIKVENIGNDLTLNEALAVIWEQRKTYLYVTFAASFTAFTSYGSTAWIPTYFARTFGLPMREIGFKYGIVVTIFSALGVLAGGWMADRFIKKGIIDGKVRVSLISGIGVLLSAACFLLSDPNVILLCMMFPAFLVSFPFGAAVAVVQEIMPNRVRALASSIFLFFVNIIGMGGGPYIVAFFTDSVFQNELMIKYSVMALYIIGGSAIILFSWLGMKSYPKALVAKSAPPQ
jgi:MFS family permease